MNDNRRHHSTLLLLALGLLPGAHALSDQATMALTAISCLVGATIAGWVMATLCAKRIRSQRRKKAHADLEARIQAGEVRVATYGGKPPQVDGRDEYSVSS